MSKRNEAIKTKLKKAGISMLEAETLLENKFYNGLISRLYYSCFYATKALLLTKDLVSKTHSGTLTLLNQKFVMENDFDPAQSGFFKNLMDQRIRSDYDDFIIVDEVQVVDLIKSAKEYVQYVSERIKKYFNENPGKADRPNLFS